MLSVFENARLGRYIASIAMATLRHYNSVRNILRWHTMAIILARYHKYGGVYWPIYIIFIFNLKATRTDLLRAV